MYINRAAYLWQEEKANASSLIQIKVKKNRLKTINCQNTGLVTLRKTSLDRRSK